MADEEGQEDELIALEAIYEDERMFIRSPEEKGGQLNISLDLPDGFLLKVRSSQVPSSLRSKATESDPDTARGTGSDHLVNVPVKHLPPIVLNFEFPKDYPSRSPPNFTLSCKWLTRLQLSKLCEYLDKLWQERGPEEIIYTWSSGLKDEALDLLKIESPCELHFAKNTKRRPQKCRMPNIGSYQVDERAIQDVGSYASMVKAVFDFDESEMERVFNSSYFQCDVCLSEKQGSVCMRFYECSHTFCRECLKEYFTVQINDGAVKNLTCPEAKCDKQAQPSQVKGLINPDLYSKYENFLLQTTLDTMEDVVYCPRTSCQTNVLLEKESTIGICPKCHYAFCIFCKKASHGISPCSITVSESRKLRDEWMKSNAEERSLMEKRYGKQRLQRVFEEVVSEAWLKENAKKCPSCGFSIQKSEGCNKMTCTKCRSHFCWLCNAVLSCGNPYLHFNRPGEGCFNRLFEGEDIDDDYEDDDDDDWFL